MTRRATLITGGAGFIGCNLADRILRTGKPVVVYDNLSRPGVERNAEWLQRSHGGRVRIHIGDVRDKEEIASAVREADQIFHLAAQVAVTTSLEDPALDFDINVVGTLNLLEAIRQQREPPPLVYTSTNKVYGGLEDLKLRETPVRYEPVDPLLRLSGIGESRGLDFHTPYGCSKGAAEQYVLDAFRSYGAPGVVFRMSCIYGAHQFGTEDQGWVAHFVLSALRGEPITIYGDGKQVRDVLFINDLIGAFLLAQQQMDRLAGQAFNIGGGPGYTLSLIELLELLRQIGGRRPEHHVETWRAGDQRYYVSDTAKFHLATGWAPAVPPREGLQKLYDWLLGNADLGHDEITAAEGVR